MRAVTEPGGRIPDWDRAVIAFRSASYNSCLLKLDGVNTLKARVLAARALIRLGRDVDALAALSSTQDVTEDAEIRGEHASLSSLALLRLGRFGEARVAQATAREHLSTVTAWAVRAELRYHESCLYYAMGEHHKSYAISVSSDRDIVTYYERASHDVVSVMFSRAALMNVKAIVELSRGRYFPAVNSLAHGLSICRSDPAFDVGLSARILSNVTATMNEDGDKQVRTFQDVLSATAELSWTPEVAHMKFLVLRQTGLLICVGWSFLKGA